MALDARETALGDLAWRAGPQAGGRLDRIKIVCDGKQPAPLFSLAGDTGESKTPARTNPKAAEVKKAPDAWLDPRSAQIRYSRHDGEGLERE